MRPPALMRALVRRRERPPLELIATPARVFRRAAGAAGGDAVGVGSSASRPGRKSTSIPSGTATPSVMQGVDGVRRSGPLQSRGGVGNPSNPGGRTGDRSMRGRSILEGEQRSMRAGLDDMRS